MELAKSSNEKNISLSSENSISLAKENLSREVAKPKRAMTSGDILRLAFKQNAFSVCDEKANRLMHEDPTEYMALENEKVTKPFMEANNLKWELDDTAANSRAKTIDLKESDYEIVTDKLPEKKLLGLGLGGKK